MGESKMKRVRDRKTPGAPLNVHIGIRLFQLRLSYGITMDQVSDESGVSRSCLSQIECGVSRPMADTLWKLSKLFGVDVNYWFEGYEKKERGNGRKH